MTTSFKLTGLLILSLATWRVYGIEILAGKDFGANKGKTLAFLQAAVCCDSLLVCTIQNSKLNSTKSSYSITEYKAVLQGADQLAKKIGIQLFSEKIPDGVYLIPVAIYRSHLGAGVDPKKYKWSRLSGTGDYIIKLKDDKDPLIKKFTQGKDFAFKHSFWKNLSEKKLHLKANVLPARLANGKLENTGEPYGDGNLGIKGKNSPIVFKLTLNNQSKETLLVLHEALMKSIVIAVSKKGHLDRSFATEARGRYIGKKLAAIIASNSGPNRNVLKWIEIPPSETYSWELSYRKGTFQNIGDYEVFPILSCWSALWSSNGSKISPLSSMADIVGDKTLISVHEKK